MLKYEQPWPDDANLLQVEFRMIQWIRDGLLAGNGLAFHYKAACQMLWPHLEWHRWAELCNAEIRRPGAKVTVFMGPGSTGKTAIAGMEYLLEYYVSPNDTLVLISSTDIRGLELRVWGEIKMLHELALERHPWLPGYLIDSKHCITTDEIEEDEVEERIKARDLRKGVMGIPTVQGGRAVGLGKWCFPAGQMVDTVLGKVPIENIKLGDFVISAIGKSRVTATLHRTAPRLVRIKTKDGRLVDCTPNHPFFTNLGWVNAIDICQDHFILSVNETLHLLRGGFDGKKKQILHEILSKVVVDKIVSFVWGGFYSKRKQGGVLLATLLGEMENATARNCCEDVGSKGLHFHWSSNQQRYQSKPERHGEKEEVGEAVCRAEQKQTLAALQSEHENGFRKHCASTVSGCSSQFKNFNWKKFKTWLCKLLRFGYFLAESQVGGGDRRQESSGIPTEIEGCGKGQIPFGSWVDSIEILEPEGDPRYCIREKGYRVYDLQIEGHPSFSVNGLIVHNCGIKQKHVRLVADDCTAMAANFLSAFSNLNNNIDFQACICFNPDDMLDPGGIAAEPMDGWGSHLEPTKTSVWDTKFYSGRCVNLVGLDSPNFDFPQDQPPRYPYLVSQRKINETLTTFGKDSFEYYSQCVGVMKISQLARRVITRDLCRQFKTAEKAVWSGRGKLIRLAALDAAYGGDRCIGGYAEFGECADGQTRLQFYPPHNVPVRIGTDKPMDAEDSISEFESAYCKAHDVPPEQFFHDSTGRGSLGTSLARIWSAACHPVEFGGAPTKRPVTMDTFTKDVQTGTRRLKRCDEHYSKFVSELWYSLRFAIEADQIRGLPEDVMNELCMRQWDRVAHDKIEVESKAEMKLRTRKSPDLGDWSAIILEGARRLGFQIKRLGNDLQDEDEGVNWLEAWQKQHETALRSKELTRA